jgi:cobalamin biosynthesis protein CobT
MKDKDTEALEKLLFESIFSGNVPKEKSDDKEDTSYDSDKEDDESDDKDSDETDDKDSDDNDSDEDSDDDSEDNDSDNSDEDDDSDSDDSDEDEDSDSDDKDSDGKVDSKVKALQKQYNDIIVDAFTKYAPDCIENALNQSDAAFGENIESILAAALEELKAKVLGDFGIETPEVCPMGAGAGVDAVDAMVGPQTMIAVREEGYKRNKKR